MDYIECNLTHGQAIWVLTWRHQFENENEKYHGLACIKYSQRCFFPSIIQTSEQYVNCKKILCKYTYQFLFIVTMGLSFNLGVAVIAQIFQFF